MQMQKGLSRRVLVVKCTDERYFEEAIFILKKDACLEQGQHPDLFLYEAEQAARKCVSRAAGPRQTPPSAKEEHRRFPPAAYAAVGAAVTAAGWLATLFLH